MAIIDSQVHVYEAHTPIFISAFSMDRDDASYAVDVQRAHPGRFADDRRD